MDLNIPNGLPDSQRLCSSAKCGLSRTFAGSKIGIEPPLRLSQGQLSTKTKVSDRTYSVRSIISNPRVQTTANLCLRKCTLSASVGMKKSLYSLNHSAR